MRIRNAAVAAILSLAANLYAADVKVTDKKGNVVEVHGVAIDYSNYELYVSSVGQTGGARYTYPPDHERQGVRAYEGDGLVTIRWSLIQAIVIKGKNTGAVPWRFDADITLKSGKVVSTGLYIWSKRGLFGETDLGNYSIELESVKSIAVLPEPIRKQ